MEPTLSDASRLMAIAFADSSEDPIDRTKEMSNFFTSPTRA